MFEIAVFSNPVTALVGESGFLSNWELGRTARYDEELVKPALLLADKVHLRSHRVDLLANKAGDLRTLEFEVPMLSRGVGISTRRDPEELALLGLTEADLLTPAGIDRIQKAFDGHESMQDVWHMIKPIQHALWQYHLSHHQLLRSQALRDLAAAGLLDETPWDPTPRSPAQLMLDSLKDENFAFERAFTAMADDVAGSQMSVMLDNTVFEGLTRFSGDELDLGSAATLGAAVNLMSMVDGLAALPIDEIAGVRSELGEYLGPFRSFMLEVATDSALQQAEGAERTRLLQLAWQRDVEPAIAEMHGHLESATFRRNAIDVFASSGETLRTMGMAIGVAVGAGFVGLSSLAAGAALAPPLLKAAITSVRARQDVERNRAYFVHALSERAKRALIK